MHDLGPIARARVSVVHARQQLKRAEADLDALILVAVRADIGWRDIADAACIDPDEVWAAAHRAARAERTRFSTEEEEPGD